MKALIWKELRDTLALAALPIVAYLIFFYPIFMRPAASRPLGDMAAVTLMLKQFAMPLAGFAGLLAVSLSVTQFGLEARGEHRALLLHRPISRLKIFMGKTMAGMAAYLLGMGLPCICFVVWVMSPPRATDPHPLSFVMPGVTSILLGAIFYFVPIIIIQREVRVYVTRLFITGPAFICCPLVYGWALKLNTSPPTDWRATDYGLALIVILVFGTLLGTAAWGAFMTGGEYAPQRRPAKAALGVALFTGIFLLGIGIKSAIGDFYDLKVKTQPPYAQALMGPITSPAEFLAYDAVVRRYGSIQQFYNEAKDNRLTQIVGLVEAGDSFIPKRTGGGGVAGVFQVLVVLLAVGCAVGCFVLATRSAFSPARRFAWTIFAAIAGIWGLLLMLALHGLPVRVPCPKCRKQRVVTRDTCEHCGAPHAPPPRDGTEVFEPTVPTTHVVVA